MSDTIHEVKDLVRNITSSNFNSLSLYTKASYVLQRPRYVNLGKIFEVSTLLPFSTVEVERGFSLLNNIKQIKETALVNNYYGLL